MIKKLLFAFTIAMLCGANLSAQTTYWVKSTGSDSNDGLSEANAFLTIDAAYAAAATGTASTRDVINIVGTIAITSELEMSKHLDFVGMSSATLSATGSSSGIFQLNNGRTFTFTDITFTGSTKNNVASTFGGAIETYANVQVTITNCTFSNNSSTTHSGAIHSSDGDFTITGCTFTSNSTVSNGGAIFITNGADFTISNSTFSSNSGGTGGAIYLNSNLGGTMSITNCLFDGNSAATGGALHTQDQGFLVTGTTFVNNTSTSNAGAVNIVGDSGLASTFTNCTFYSNSTNGNFGGNGGAIRVSGSTTLKDISFINCLFNNNKRDADGTPAAGDVGSGGGQAINYIATNSLFQSASITNATSGTSTFTNNNSTFNSSMSIAGITYSSPNVTFTAPSSISDDTPIDFGNDSSDAGAWNSNINLFKGSTDSDWGTAGNWSGTVPTATDNVTLLSDSPALVIGATTGAVCNDLSVNGSSSLTINAGGSLIVSGSSTGNVTYNRTLTFVSGNTAGWHLISSPVAGETFDNSFATDNSLATSSTRRGLAYYNDANSAGSKYVYLESDDSNASAFSSGTYSGSGVGYIAKRSATGTVAFTGTINTADVGSVSVSNSGNGFNLIGNPYTSYISSQTFLGANSNLEATIWTWTEGSGFTARTSGENFIVAPGQGFFVDATSSGTVTFAESNQSSGTDNFQKTAKTQVNLSINNGSKTRGAKVYYLSNATDGLDYGYEGKIFGGYSEDLAIYTHLLSGSVGDDYQVQSLPNSNLEDMVIPVGVNATAGKEITISAEALNLPQGLKVFLEDRSNGSFTELTASNFTTTLKSDLNGIGRFYLHTKSSALSTENVELSGVSIYTLDRSTLRLAGLSQGNAKVKLYNILGKQMLNASFETTGVSDVKLPSLSTGIYIVQLETENGKLNKKIALD